MCNAVNKRTPAKILVVDDTVANLQLLTNLLRAEGYNVYPASDGELALEFVSNTLPDLILLDIRMPGLDGYEVCRQLKADELSREVPVIFISILEDEHDKVKGFRAGAVDYITKPFQPEEVLARIATHLRLRELSEKLELQVAERTAALRASEERFRLTLEATRIGVFDWDVEHDCWSASPAYYTMLGYEPNDGPGDRREWIERLHPDDKALFIEKMEDVLLRNHPVYQYEARLRHADGSYRWQFVKGFGISRDQTGKLTRMLGVRMDIHERKRMEEELASYRQHLEQEVKKRTAELEKSNEELERMNGLFVGRELRMVELKKRIEELEEKGGQR